MCSKQARRDPYWTLAHTQNGTLTKSGLLKCGKSGEMSNTSTERPVDDDLDSDTATESNLSPRSRSFLNRVNARLRKILDHSSEDAMQDINKRSLVW